MSLSSFCTEQREREKQQLKSFLAFSLTGSAVLHLIVLGLGAIIPWERALEPEAEPIEVVVVEPTKPQEQPEEKEKEEAKLGRSSDSLGGSSISNGLAGGSGKMPLASSLGAFSAEGGTESKLGGTLSGRQTQETFPRQSLIATVWTVF